jgi:hypothetical protein
VKAPHKEALLKALEQIIECADGTLAAATGSPRPPAGGNSLRVDQQATVLAGGLRHVRAIARTARGDSRWGRRPSLTPLPPEEAE